MLGQGSSLASGYYKPNDFWMTKLDPIDHPRIHVYPYQKAETVIRLTLTDCDEKGYFIAELTKNYNQEQIFKNVILLKTRIIDPSWN